MKALDSGRSSRAAPAWGQWLGLGLGFGFGLGLGFGFGFGLGLGLSGSSRAAAARFASHHALSSGVEASPGEGWGQG